MIINIALTGICGMSMIVTYNRLVGMIDWGEVCGGWRTNDRDGSE
jgi:hypothetical protein